MCTSKRASVWQNIQSCADNLEGGGVLTSLVNTHIYNVQSDWRTHTRCDARTCKSAVETFHRTSQEKVPTAVDCDLLAIKFILDCVACSLLNTHTHKPCKRWWTYTDTAWRGPSTVPPKRSKRTRKSAQRVKLMLIVWPLNARSLTHTHTHTTIKVMMNIYTQPCAYLQKRRKITFQANNKSVAWGALTAA